MGCGACITFVTLGELTQWAELRRWGRRNRDALDSWLDGVIILIESLTGRDTSNDEVTIRPEVGDGLDEATQARLPGALARRP